MTTALPSGRTKWLWSIRFTNLSSAFQGALARCHLFRRNVERRVEQPVRDRQCVISPEDVQKVYFRQRIRPTISSGVDPSLGQDALDVLVRRASTFKLIRHGTPVQPQQITVIHTAPLRHSLRSRSATSIPNILTTTSNIALT